MKTNKEKVQDLLQEALQYLQENRRSSKSLIASGEDAAYFSMKTPTIHSPLPSPSVSSARVFATPSTKRRETNRDTSYKEDKLTPSVEKIKSAKEEKLIEKEVSAKKTGVDTLNFEALRDAVHKTFPSFVIKKTIPDDRLAYLRENEWKEEGLQVEVVLLSFHESVESDLFLQNIAQAISSYFSSAQVIDAQQWGKQKKWDLFFEKNQAKLVLSSPQLLKQAFLLPYYKEIPSTTERFFGSIRLHMLSSLDSYFKNPSQKKDLWQALCAILKNLNMPVSSSIKP